MMSEKITIFIIEDDEVLGRELKEYLLKWNYEVNIAVHFHDITNEFLETEPHIVLMDINLPFYDGFYWCHQIRECSEVPIFFISSRYDDKDKIMAIAQGGDDYIEKPFNLDLLRAKIDAMLRRAYQYKLRDKIVIIQDLIFDVGIQKLFYQSTEIDLTKTEIHILMKLLENRNKVVSRDNLMMELWNTDEYVSDGTLTTAISRLRSKLNSYCKKEIIVTKKGRGYVIE